MRFLLLLFAALAMCQAAEIFRQKQDVASESEGNCGDALFEEGVFSTPQYPSPYPNRQVCTWTLTAPEGKVIRLVFTNFSLEHGVECSYDNVKVYNGPTAVPRNLVKTLCGTKPLIEHVGAKVVTVVFTSNDKIQETGFTAFFHSIPDPTLPEIHVQGQATCGGDYRGAFGTIESPNYPQLYPNNLNCSYTITVPSGNVQLEFLHLDIEYHHSCQRDYIEIREENSSGKLLRTVCGSPKSRKISSTTLSLHLRFISDYTLQGTGFYATWKNGDNGEGDKDNGLDKFISTTPRASTTNRPIITVRQPSSTDPAIVVSSSTTAKPTPATPEKSTVAATTAKVTPPPAEKSSTTGATKLAFTPPKDNSGTTQQASTTKRPIFTVRQTPSTDPAIVVGSSTKMMPTPATPQKSTIVATTAKATPPPAEESSTAAATKPAFTTSKDNGGQDKFTGTQQAVSADKPKPDELDTTPRTSTTRRPIITIRQPSSTARTITVSSSTTKPTEQTAGTTKFAPTTAKATAAPADKTSPATSTKPAIPTASFKTTPDVKTTATTAAKTVATAETKTSTPTSTSQTVTRDPITPSSANYKSTSPSTTTTPGPPTVSSGKFPTASPSTCNIYPTSPTATPRPTPPNFDSDACTSNGYLHRLVLNSCCSLYMHQADDGLMKLRECATGTRFDVYSCSCRNSAVVTCIDRLPALPTTPAAPTHATPAAKIVPPVRIGDMCVSNKNVYRVIANSGCTKFTQQGEDSHVASHDCPAGTKFDLEVCTCRHGFEFQCSDKTLDSTKTTPASIPSWTSHPPQRPTDPPIRIGDLCVGHGKAYGVVPRTGCTKFSQQTPDGRIFEHQCPQGLKFDIDICVCRYESDFTCPDKTPSIQVTGRPAPIPTEKPESRLPPIRLGDECRYMGSVYRLMTESGCARFTQLGEDGRVHAHECPGGLLFNLDSCSCSYAEEVKCPEKVVDVTQKPEGAPTTRVTQGVQGNTCIVGGNVYAVVPGTGCTRFTQEVAGVRPFVHSCPPGLGFDLKACVCRYFDEAFSCGDKVNGHLGPMASGPLPTIKVDHPRRVGDTCISAGNIYGVLLGTWCTKFTQEATGGHRFIHSCPPGLGFDLDVCVCRLYDDQFSCGGKINEPVIPTTQPSHAIVRSTPSASRTGDACVSHGSTYRLAPKEGCRWFTQTSSDGQMLLHHCPDGLKFDLDVCVCRFSSDFVCLEEETTKVVLTTVAPKTTTIKATTALARTGDSCFVNGVTYRLLPYCGCSRYTERRPAAGGDDLRLHECLAGSLFDLDKCTCRPSGSFVCTDPAPV